MDKWFTELHGLNASDDIGLTFRIKEILYSKKSAFQKIEAFGYIGVGDLGGRRPVKEALDVAAVVEIVSVFVVEEVAVDALQAAAHYIQRAVVVIAQQLHGVVFKFGVFDKVFFDGIGDGACQGSVKRMGELRYQFVIEVFGQVDLGHLVVGQRDGRDGADRVAAVDTRRLDVFHHAADDLDMVVQFSFRRDIQNRSTGAELGIGDSIDDGFDS